jgi:PsbP
MPSLMDWIREDEIAAIEVADTTAGVSAPNAGRSRRRRWPWIAVAAICVVGCGVTAWVTLHRPAQITQQPAASRPSGFVTYTDSGGHYRISYPRNWQRASDTDGGVVLHVRGRDAVSIREFTLAKPVDTHNVADMRAVTDAILSVPTAHLTVLESQVVQVGALSGLYYLYYFPAGDQRGVHAHYFLFSGTRMYTLVFQTLPATDFQQLAKTLDAVAETFTVTSNR